MNCKNGHSVSHRFTTAQGHSRCRLCLQAARDRYAEKRDPSKALGRAFRVSAIAIGILPPEQRSRVVQALEVFFR